MVLKSVIVEVTAENLSEHPGAICFINPTNEHFGHKITWLKEQFKNGLKIKLLYLDGEKNPKGFIEYVPGEYCWRPVKAKGYMFIHCLWTHDKKYQKQGLGGELIAEVEKDAEGMDGVAVMTSDGSFMAKSNIFLKNGYKPADTSGKDQLLVKQFRNTRLPEFSHHGYDLKKFRGLAFIYSCQCPWVARFIEEVKPILKEANIQPEVIELKTHIDAQNAPSVYGTFNMINNGRLLADRYISVTRFQNIIRKEIR